MVQQRNVAEGQLRVQEGYQCHGAGDYRLRVVFVLYARLQLVDIVGSEEAYPKEAEWNCRSMARQ
jgi:hypothetical protein